MVAQLVAAGRAVRCFDPDQNIQQRMRAVGAQTKETLAELAQSSEVIILSLPNAQIVEAVMAELSDHVGTGAIILDTSTSTPGTSQKMASLGKSKGFDFIDGPVSGGPAAANSGTMTMLMPVIQTRLRACVQ